MYVSADDLANKLKKTVIDWPTAMKTYHI